MTIGKDAWAFGDEHVQIPAEHRLLSVAEKGRGDDLASSSSDVVFNTISQSRDYAHL